MKKLFTSLTALALVSAMVVPMAAFADEQISGPTGSAPARGIVEAAYTVTIPSSITINSANAQTPTPFTVTVGSTNCPLTVTASAVEGGAVKRARVFEGTNGLVWDEFDEWLPTSVAAYELVTDDSYTRFFRFDADGEPADNNQRGVAQWTKTPTVGFYQGQVTFTIEPTEMG